MNMVLVMVMISCDSQASFPRLVLNIVVWVVASGGLFKSSPFCKLGDSDVRNS